MDRALLDEGERLALLLLEGVDLLLQLEALPVGCRGKISVCSRSGGGENSLSLLLELQDGARTLGDLLDQLLLQAPRLALPLLVDMLEGLDASLDLLDEEGEVIVSREGAFADVDGCLFLGGEGEDGVELAELRVERLEDPLELVLGGSGRIDGREDDLGGGEGVPRFFELRRGRLGRFDEERQAVERLPEALVERYDLFVMAVGLERRDEVVGEGSEDLVGERLRRVELAGRLAELAIEVDEVSPNGANVGEGSARRVGKVGRGGEAARVDEGPQLRAKLALGLVDDLVADLELLKLLDVAVVGSDEWNVRAVSNVRVESKLISLTPSRFRWPCTAHRWLSSPPPSCF